MSLNISRQTSSPYFDGSSYEIFEAISDNNTRFEQLQTEVDALTADVAKKCGDLQRNIQDQLKRLEGYVESLQAQIHTVNREIAHQRASFSDGFHQLSVRASNQEKKLTAIEQKVDYLCRMMGGSSQRAYYAVAPKSYPYSK